jgi:hypothetical protein
VQNIFRGTQVFLPKRADFERRDLQAVPVVRVSAAERPPRQVCGFVDTAGAPSGKRRWRARTPRPDGVSAARLGREAFWSAERRFHFGAAAAGANEALSPNRKNSVSHPPSAGVCRGG